MMRQERERTPPGAAGPKGPRRWAEIAALAGILAAAGTAGAPVRAAQPGTCFPAVPCTDLRGCPDLVVDASDLAADLAVERRRFRDRDCSVVEGEVAAGWRLLQLFTTTTPNLGPGDLFIGDPNAHPEWFDLETCHGHAHLKEYSDYRLWTPAGYERWLALRAASPLRCARDLLRDHPDLVSEMVVGRKQGFCLADISLSQVPCHAPPDPAKYPAFCTYQGISVCWADVYGTYLDGQWVDITYVPTGDYVLEVEVNAEYFFEELDTANNASAILLRVENPTLEVCDGSDNDLDGGVDNTDLDQDGFLLCADDCNDRNASVHPGAVEVCNGLDDDCDGATDETAADSDADGVGDLCDNCAAVPNPGQADADGDREGDDCDLDDGRLLFTGVAPASLDWQPDVVYDSFNLYRGDLAVLRASGEYTQDPSTTPGAARFCGAPPGGAPDPYAPPPGGAAFYLVTGVASGVESGLGETSAGDGRTHSFPCP